MTDRFSPASKGTSAESKGISISSTDLLKAGKTIAEGVNMSNVLPEAAKFVPGTLKVAFEYLLCIADFFEHRDDMRKASYCEGYAKAITLAAYGKAPASLMFKFYIGEELIEVQEKNIHRLEQLLEQVKMSHDKIREKIYRTAYENCLAFYDGQRAALRAINNNVQSGKLDMFTSMNILYRSLCKNAKVKEVFLQPIQF
jgi:hypothetical protein